MNRPQWHVKGQINFVKNDLMILRATHSVTGTDANMMLLLKSYDILKHRVCYHFTALHKVENYTYIWNQYCTTHLKCPPPPPCEHGGCTWCLTDWSYEVERQNELVTLRIVTYHMIGDGLSNLDDKWCILTSREMAVGNRGEIYKEYPRGSLSRLWAETDSATSGHQARMTDGDVYKLRKNN